MPNKTIALVGDGVQSRRDLLHSYLHSTWEIINYDPSPQNAECPAAVAIGMPGALNWQEHFPQLNFLQLPGAGLDGLQPTHLQGVHVSNVYEHEGSIAEYLFASLFQLDSSWLASSEKAFRQLEWPYFDRIGHGVRPSITSKTFGVFGFGTIGRRCAHIAKLFNMNVIAHSKNPDKYTGPDAGFVSEFVDEFVSRDQLFAQSDYLVISSVLNDETRGLITCQEFDQMKSSAVLINVARAHILNEGDLFKTLSEKKIRAAILDTWYQYPQSQEERLFGSTYDFTGLDNVTLTPHLAANTEDMVNRRWRFMAENIERFAAQQPLQNQVL